MDDGLSDFFEEHELCNAKNKLSGDDIFSILESLEESVMEFPVPLSHENAAAFCSKDKEETTTGRLASQKSTSSSTFQDYSETEFETSPKSNKRLKLSAGTTTCEEANPDGQQRISHITVERNRRKQMNEHLSMLRSLMPCFYVKRVRLICSTKFTTIYFISLPIYF